MTEEQRGAPQRPRRRAERLLGAPAASSAPAEPRERRDAPRSVRGAALVVAVEAAAVAVATVVLLGALLTGRVASTGNAIGLLLVAVLGLGLLMACARGLWRVASWARAPVVVVQVILAFIGYNAAFPWHAPQVGVPMLVAVAAILYLLATPEARLAFFQRRS